MRTAAITGLLCVTMIAMLADLKTGKIPNGLIAAGVAMGVCFQVLSERVAGILVFAGGLLLPLLLMGGLFYFRMAGAGDIKLLCVTGGFLGPADGFRVLIASLLIGGVISVWIMIRQKNFTGRMMYFMEYAQRRAAGGSWESYMADVPESAKFCFSVPVFLSVLGYIGGIF
ncbi:MAG: prepilin peptidase [Lachnospiraceae bacterium]|nr:prepilin peptidase [Lachnospiraceae bacterium]